MTPAEIIGKASADGVGLFLSAGKMKAVGDEAAVNRWLPIFRERKHAILAYIRDCSDSCSARLERPDLPGEIVDLAVLARPDPLPPVPRGLGGYATPPGVPPLGDCELARQIRSMPEDDPVPDVAEVLNDTAAGALWWGVSITEPGGRTVEVDTPSGWTLPDWQAYAAHYHGPGCDVRPIAGLPKPRAPANLDEALAAACDGGGGITPEGFRSLLSPEDVADIEAGAIHAKTLRAYAQSFAEGIRSGCVVVLPGWAASP